MDQIGTIPPGKRRPGMIFYDSVTHTTLIYLMKDRRIHDTDTGMYEIDSYGDEHWMYIIGSDRTIWYDTVAESHLSTLAYGGYATLSLFIRISRLYAAICRDIHNDDIYNLWQHFRVL